MIFNKKTHSLLNFIFIFLLLIGLYGCGSGSPAGANLGPIHVGNVPQLFLNELGDGTLRITLEVFGPDGALEYTTELQINEATGEIFSNQFELETGFTYTFLITFHYLAPGFPELPVAFVAKVAATEGDSLAVFWEESELITANGQLSPEVSASMSVSTLPDLDSDDDGYDNFSEFREDSDPLDPNSIPAAPELLFADVLHTQDYVEVVMEFSDASGISRITPEDPVCGYFTWEIEDLSPGGKHQRLTAKFSLHSLPTIGSEITLNIKINDVLGLSEVYPVTATGIGRGVLAAGDPLNLPQIAIISPQPGETVSDFVTVHAIACDEDGINSLVVVGLGVIPDSNSDPKVFQGTLDTTTLGDGPQNITLKANDNLFKENSKSVQVVIANQNPIKIDVPQPGQVLKDGFTVAAHVDKGLMANVANLFIEAITDDAGNEIFGLNQLKFDVNSLPEAFTGQIYDTSLVDNQTFKIWYVAVGSDGGREERQVTYVINNQPVVNYFTTLGLQGPEACLLGGRVDVTWSVGNLEPQGSVTMAGIPVPDDGSSESFGNPGQPVPIPCSSTILLTAKRIGTDQSTGLPKEITTDQPLDLATLEMIDSPEDNSPILPDDLRIEFAADQHGELVNLNELRWLVELKNETTGGPIQSKIVQGSVIDAADLAPQIILEPRSDYTLNLKLLGSGSDTVFVSQKNGIPFTTSDVGLIGWYKMDTANLGLDWSFSNNDAFNAGAGVDLLSSGCIEGGCGDFDGSSYLGVGGFTQTQSITLEAWVNWDAAIGNSGIIFKEDQFELKVIDPNLLFIVHDGTGAPPTLSFPIASLSPNTWYHIAATFKVNPGDDELKLFINGDLKASGILSGSISQSSNTLLLGIDFPRIFTGQMDELAIYNRPLSFTEINENCDRVAPGGMCPPAP